MKSTMYSDKNIAVLIPCYQEEQTIAKVVGDFKRVLPEAAIYVYDNNSTDKTAEKARNAGAVIRREKRQGKGFVVATMFDQVEADYYVMVDGDDTYEANCVNQLLAPLLNEEADMTVASRLSDFGDKSFRQFHIFGNRLIVFLINQIFKSNLTDIFSGYRGFTRKAVKSIPITAAGFDVETELTLQALYRGLVIKEYPAPYRARPEGSHSKLNTFQDGFKVLVKFLLIMKSYKPLTFFGLLGILFFGVGVIFGYNPIYEFISSSHIYSVPRAIMATSLMLLSFFSIALGIILHSINFRLLELEKIMSKRT